MTDAEEYFQRSLKGRTRPAHGTKCEKVGGTRFYTFKDQSCAAKCETGVVVVLAHAPDQIIRIMKEMG